MDGPTCDDRILLTMEAEAKSERFVALPCPGYGWEIRDIVECKTYVFADSIQRAICECVAKILNLVDNQKGDKA